MASPDPSQAVMVPGRLCVAPTDLSADFPHGGTALGLVRAIAVRPARARQEIKAEEFGVETVDVLDLGEAWVLAATLRGLDDDAVQRLFPSTAAGSSSGKRVVSYPGSFRAGTLRSASSVVLAFSPDDPDRHPMVLLYRALPLVEEAAELALSLVSPLEVAVAFVGIRDASGRVVAVGLREDLSL